MPRLDSLDRLLRLILMLAGNTSYNASELAERLDMGSRNIYYYLEHLRQSEMIDLVRCDGNYRIDRQSPFFDALRERIHLTPDEAVALLRLMRTSGADMNNTLLRRIAAKLARQTDTQVLADTPVEQHTAHCQATLYHAIEQHLCVVIKGYRSVNSNTTRNRRVEPFAFLPGNEEVRCYEAESGACRTFRISRMEDVQLMDVYWEYEERHSTLFTDMFHFSSNELHHVVMTLGRNAHQMLLEECPTAQSFMQQQSDSQWLLDAQLCSYKAIARFTLGLMDDIQPLGDDDFLRYLRQRSTVINQRLA